MPLSVLEETHTSHTLFKLDCIELKGPDLSVPFKDQLDIGQGSLALQGLECLYLALYPAFDLCPSNIAQAPSCAMLPHNSAELDSCSC